MRAALALTLFSMFRLDPCTTVGGDAGAGSTSDATTGSTSGTLPGVWKATYTTAAGTTTSEITMQEDTGYTQQIYVGGVLTTITGTFNVPALGTIDFSVQDYDPKQTCDSAGNCTAVSFPVVVTDTYSFLDTDTLVLTNTDSACARGGAGCTVSFKRQVL